MADAEERTGRTEQMKKKQKEKEGNKTGNSSGPSWAAVAAAKPPEQTGNKKERQGTSKTASSSSLTH